jgi:hypothetical protein
MTDREQWVIWNGSLGFLDMATIGHVEDGESGRSAFLDRLWRMSGYVAAEMAGGSGSIYALKRRKSAGPFCFSRISTTMLGSIVKS